MSTPEPKPDEPQAVVTGDGGPPIWFSKSASNSALRCLAADFMTFSRWRTMRCRSSRSPLVMAVCLLMSLPLLIPAETKWHFGAFGFLQRFESAL